MNCGFESHRVFSKQHNCTCTASIKFCRIWHPVRTPWCIFGTPYFVTRISLNIAGHSEIVLVANIWKTLKLFWLDVLKNVRFCNWIVQGPSIFEDLLTCKKNVFTNLKSVLANDFVICLCKISYWIGTILK
jgi:hypothetical protein